MKVAVRHSCAEFDSYRAARVKAMFNCESGANFTLDAGIPAHDPGRALPAAWVPEGVELIVAAHAHCFMTRRARARTRYGAIGYHQACCRGTEAATPFAGPSTCATRSPAAPSTG